MKSLGQTLLEPRRFNQVLVACVAVGFLALALVAGYGLFVMQRNVAYTALVQHTYDVQNSVADFRILNERIEAARRGFLLSGEQRFAKVYEDTTRLLPVSLQRIRTLTSDNPSQQRRLARLAELIALQGKAGAASVDTVRRGGTGPVLHFDLDAAVQATREIRTLTAEMAAEEQRLLEARNDERLVSVANLARVAILAGALLVLVAGSSLWVIIAFTRDLTRSRNDLRKLNAGLEDTVAARTVDLQRANDEIQRFAYIVSHDLRSPLVNVMGFTAELEAGIQPLADLVKQADADAPHLVSPEARRSIEEDLPESLGFIRSSTAKMDRLINAILRLSREGRRVLSPEPVEVGQLVGSITDSMQHRINELGAEVSVDGDIPPIVTDRLALEQILSNLIENALKYLKPGRPGRIEVRGRRDGARIIVEVTDNGRGIDPKDHDRIFDLFRRSGAQDQPGEGIGLAHVRALTYRLGGIIQCQSALDQGATFRVSLPARQSVGVTS